MLAKPSAVLFDLDGTLVDSTFHFLNAVRFVLQTHQRPVSEEESMAMVGHSVSTIYHSLHQRTPLPVSLPVFEHEVHEDCLVRVQTHGAVALPGVIEVVQRISRAYPCALVTGARRKNAESIIKSFGIASCFRTMICAGEASDEKPSPFPYLLAAKKLSLPPSACIAVEDSSVGIAAARAARMICVAVRAGNSTNQDQSGANFVVDTLSHFETWLNGLR